MIVKCQKPLCTNSVPMVLIYNKTRTVVRQEPYTKSWNKWFGSKLKFYAKAHVEGTILVIDEIVKDQPW